MNKYINNSSNLHAFLICLDLCIFCVILLPKRCFGAHFQYEACAPKNCSHGPNISFPFHISGAQADYCGYPWPGFNISCGGHGFPVLELPENDYVVDDIFYESHSLHVYAAAVLESNDSSCIPSIRNTTIWDGQFSYVNSTELYLFSGCRRPFPEGLQRYNVSCRDGTSNWDLALYGKDENLRIAMEVCGRNVVAPVGLDYGDDEIFGIVKVKEVLRRGFELNWTASNCSKCEESGGRCGFELQSFHFRCFCPDRPHRVSCKPGCFLIVRKRACRGCGV